VVKFQPPNATDASSTITMSAPNTGRIAARALVQAALKDSVIESVLRSATASIDSERRIMPARCAATVPPIATNAALPPIMVAKVLSSRERGI
jgi:hypothetical protein